MAPPSDPSRFGPGNIKIPTESPPVIRTILIAVALAALMNGCTSEPLISRKGVSGLAIGELGVEAVLALAEVGSKTGGVPLVPDTVKIEDWNYIGGIIPVKPSAFGSEHRVDNGTRFFVDGHKRGMLPQVGTLGKPGPHQIRLELPVFETYTLTLGDPFILHTPQGDLEAWPPVIVDMLTGGIFTTHETSAVDVNRNSGTRQKTDIAQKVGRDPLLIVTTTDKPKPGWRKLGQMRVPGRVDGTARSGN